MRGFSLPNTLVCVVGAATIIGELVRFTIMEGNCRMSTVWLFNSRGGVSMTYRAMYMTMFAIHFAIFVLLGSYGTNISALHNQTQYDQIVYKESFDWHISKTNRETSTEIEVSTDGETAIDEKTSVVLEPFYLIRSETILCAGMDISLALGRTITNVGSAAERFSVAYDALLESNCTMESDVTVEVKPLFAKDASVSGAVAVMRVVACETCTLMHDEPDLYAIIMTSDVYDNIFQCERDTRKYEAGADTSLKCRRNV